MHYILYALTIIYIIYYTRCLLCVYNICIRVQYYTYHTLYVYTTIYVIYYTRCLLCVYVYTCTHARTHTIHMYAHTQYICTHTHTHTLHMYTRTHAHTCHLPTHTTVVYYVAKTVSTHRILCSKNTHATCRHTLL